MKNAIVKKFGYAIGVFGIIILMFALIPTSAIVDFFTPKEIGASMMAGLGAVLMGFWFLPKILKEE